MTIREMLSSGRKAPDIQLRAARREQYKHDYNVAMLQGVAAFFSVYIPFTLLLFLLKKFL